MINKSMVRLTVISECVPASTQIKLLKLWQVFNDM